MVAEAIARMRGALEEMIVDGIETNIPLHRELLNDPEFVKGGTDIHHLSRRFATASPTR